MDRIPISFAGHDDLFLFGDFDRGGPIATMAQYDDFAISFAHLTKDGRVMRYGLVIGDKSQIKLRGGDDT